MPNSDFRIAGIQSRTTQPASAGSVKYSTSRMNEPLPRSSRSARPGPVGDARGTSPAAAGRAGFRRKRNSGTAYAMPTMPQASKAQRQPRVGSIGHIAAEAADDDADIDPHLVETDCPRARGAGMEIRDQRQRRGNVERLAHPHERTGREQPFVGGHMPGRPRHDRPHEQAAGDHVPATVAIREISRQRG